MTGRAPFEAPAAPVLLHCCCATCSGEIIEALAASSIAFTVFYYNPNIHPAEEYERRKADNKAFCEKLGVPFVDADYDAPRWHALAKGLEHEPERGARCTMCFDMRLGETARYAAAHGFPLIATSLGISRWKNLEQVNGAGVRAASAAGVGFWPVNWRKKGGAERRFAIAKREGFYQQSWCGCLYSHAATLAAKAAKNKLS